jgi:hypothetical protein
MQKTLTYLLEDLEDPISFFPIQSVSRSLQQLVESADEDFQSRMGPNGVARKYWDVPSELLYEEIGLLIGAAFVLGQAMITQTISITKKIHELTSQTSGLPDTKASILFFRASTHERSGKSHPGIIDLAANFFKHHNEWPEGWALCDGRGLQKRTIEECLAVGMSPRRDVTDNLFAALNALGNHSNSVQSIQASIEQWREGLARHLYAALEIDDPKLQG